MQQPRTHCIRCGKCCKSSSPSLQKEDYDLIEKGFIRIDQLFTIRKGELVRDNIEGRIRRLGYEMVKIKEKENGACIFYDAQESACTIYRDRPIQCRALKCWDTREYMRIYKKEKLTRKDIIKDKDLLLLIEEHERRCSHLQLETLVSNIPNRGEEAVNGILDMLRFDFHIRSFLSKRLGIPKEYMPFYFGRPLMDIISVYGLRVIKEDNNTFLLTSA